MMPPNKAPLVSVIIATYNGSNTIIESIESVIKQTYSNIELIIVNDCSIDSTQKKLDVYSDNKKILILNNKKNIGLARSLNLGIRASSGEFIARMDDDDVSYENRIEQQVAYFLRNPDTDVLGTAVRFITEGQCHNIREYYPPKSHDDIKNALCYSNPIIHPSVMFTRVFFNISGGYSETLRRKEDLDLWGRMVKKVKFHNLQEVLIDYRVKQSKTLTAVPAGVYVRLLNGFRLSCIFKAFLWSVRYVFIEVARHFGYVQRQYKREQR